MVDTLRMMISPFEGQFIVTLEPIYLTHGRMNKPKTAKGGKMGGSNEISKYFLTPSLSLKFTH